MGICRGGTCFKTGSGHSQKGNLASRARLYRSTFSSGPCKTGPPRVFGRVCPERRGTGFSGKPFASASSGRRQIRKASEKQVGDVSGRHRSERYGSCSNVGNSGSQKVEVPSRRVRRPRNTNDREDRAIRRVATSAPTTSLASIQRHLPPSRHPVPSRETIRRRLTEVGLRSRRPLRRYHRPHIIGSVDWIFADLGQLGVRTGQRSDPAFIVERHTAISQGVTVWGAISWDTRSSLVVLQGTLTARRYVDDILTPIVLPMLSSRPGAIYQQDNAHPHTARLSQQCLQGYDVLPCPARSPDLSPIEHVWTRWEGNCSRPEIQEN
ncbi:HTH_Tnp_Tc3_2 domain-containing protein [Trichonephila clavipes]|nr:HTH_Tnp_Tc3_2 domain-containing protein [Trichonephila clavipes]